MGPRAITRLARAAGVTFNDLARYAPVTDARFDVGLRLNRVCGPDAWDDPEWQAVWRALQLPDGIIHRKGFEWTQCIYGLERLGGLGPNARVLGVGAGHEWILFHLANRSRLTVATDLYQGHFVDTPAG